MFDEVNLALGAGVDHLVIDSTVDGLTNVSTGAGGDIVKIETFFGVVNLDTDEDSDTITLFDDIDDAVGDGAHLTLDGGEDGDKYSITVANNVASASFIDLKDSGASGDDRLAYKGSNSTLQGDLYSSIPYMMMLLMILKIVGSIMVFMVMV